MIRLFRDVTIELYARFLLPPLLSMVEPRLTDTLQQRTPAI